MKYEIQYQYHTDDWGYLQWGSMNKTYTNKKKALKDLKALKEYRKKGSKWRLIQILDTNESE